MGTMIIKDIIPESPLKTKLQHNDSFSENANKISDALSSQEREELNSLRLLKRQYECE
jgi:hypothetical protein